jgi:Zn-dependent peptidase ImmA (M78 family)/transcriptional regulator with XRE-family HTH domain
MTGSSMLTLGRAFDVPGWGCYFPVMDFSVGARIARTRERMGISAYELAQRAGVPFEALVALEKGEAADISTAAVARIARQLDVDVSEWFSAERPTSQPALFFRQAGIPDFFEQDRQPVVVALREARAIASVDMLLGRRYDKRANFSPRDVGSIPFDDGYKLAQSVRRSLGQPTQPLGSVVSLVEDEFGVPVLAAKLHTQRVLALTAKERDSDLVAVILNQAQPNARVHVVHELAHVLFDRPVQDVDYWIDLDDDREAQTVKTEQRAKAFAAELLIPQEGLAVQFGRPMQLSGFAAAIKLARQVGEHFRTPPELTTNHLVNRKYIASELREQVTESLAIPAYPRPTPRPKMLERRVAEALSGGLITQMRARELLDITAYDALPPSLYAHE